MQVEFSKKKGGVVVMTVIRNNGTVTWSKLRKDMEDHDLAHIAVEKELRMNGGFFGLIEQGVDIRDFEDKNKQPVIDLESNQIEYLVNHLQVDYRSKDDIDVLAVLSDTLSSRDIPMIKGLTSDKISAIRLSYHQKIEELAALETDGKLIYNIDI